MNIDSRQNSI